MVVQVLPAYNGDSIFIHYENGCILVDGGLAASYIEEIKDRLNEIEKIDLLVVTHIDDDHIGGILEMFADEELIVGKIDKVWFNSKSVLSDYFALPAISDDTVFLFNKRDMSVSGANVLERRLKELGICLKVVQVDERLRENNRFLMKNGAEIILLSPYRESLLNLMTKKFKVELKELQCRAVSDYKTLLSDFFIYFDRKDVSVKFKRDYSGANESSIAFILKIENRTILMLGDAHPGRIVDSLKGIELPGNKLKIDLMKVSHHGSRGNTNDELLELVDCEHFIISTNGGYNLPDKQCLARILYHNRKKGLETNFYFNYGDELIPEIFEVDGSLVEREYNMKLHNLEHNSYEIKL